MIAPARRRAARSRAGLLAVAAGLVLHFAADSAAGSFAADALYAVLLFALVALVVPRWPALRIAAVVFAACAAIELAQLTGVPAWLSTAIPGAALVFGTTFQFTDLIAYAFGAALAAAVDGGIGKRAAGSP
ncbi:hypothetical protein O159_09280 [Leifsonia xyli subsp. cynodontis DSM 46306]|uniref:DUF2809 domain-containing protein n=1 Tax=Leifsonia xyli subsp. cynodontis DSM 46306 TaxID=1389489 RepID=U3PC23_LEIXC|nr:DUF2809 domain-containing protein [Leifsonia xyli]AGW41063.1 hypothetical protein O159_09280 [Leifsonia xyli subsp. cynodontis DSM 46306]